MIISRKNLKASPFWPLRGRRLPCSVVFKPGQRLLRKKCNLFVEENSSFPPGINLKGCPAYFCSRLSNRKLQIQICWWPKQILYTCGCRGTSIPCHRWPNSQSWTIQIKSSFRLIEEQSIFLNEPDRNWRGLHRGISSGLWGIKPIFPDSGISSSRAVLPHRSGESLSARRNLMFILR